MERKNLLTSVQMAEFVSHGALRMDAVVPAALNARAIDVFTAGIASVPYGSTVDEAFPVGSFVRQLIDLPAVAGAIHSLVGPGPTIDHHHVHIREPHGGEAQPLHGDAIIDVRPDAFDMQLMYYPHEVTADMGGTLSVPGSHLRRTNESDTGRYQNLRGQTRLTCPAVRPARLSCCTTESGTAAVAMTVTFRAICSKSVSTRRSVRSVSGTPTTSTTRL
ncbi:phytanoyl-CoA dioxygenase family protein [Fodinicola feengrottensis]|uniref:phytanoyl-CoA dioxygenase family protein n=1 Tax=Fodinicola feengrottensis TaxID=435914 RepID=UPI00244279F6|nr:phytanoyl-CoA dioxygenase family protein [Fodinicola feengrottensis]